MVRYGGLAKGFYLKTVNWVGVAIKAKKIIDYNVV